MKIDVAVQSFKKPELLLYTLLTLKKTSEDYIENIWIQDDSDDNETIEFYKTDLFQKSLYPWKINIKKNTQRGGWWFTPVKGLYPRYLSLYKRIIFSLRAKYKGTGFSLERENSRYQWAIDNTKNEYLMIIHDDIEFYNDIILSALEKFKKNPNLAIIGDLGQCWRCNYQNQGCNPQKIITGYRPSLFWPDIDPKSKGHRWACRINEWCCILNIGVAKKIELEHSVLFGGYDNHGDIAAYWFGLLNEMGYAFDDIAESKEDKDKLYLHADGGSGHSVWVDQGDGKKVYDKSIIKKMILEKFDLYIE